MIACIREEFVTEDERMRYLEQIEANQVYIRRYVTFIDSVNNLHLLASQMAVGQPCQHEYLGNTCCKLAGALTTLRSDPLT